MGSRRVRQPRSGYEPAAEFIKWSREHRVYRPVVVDEPVRRSFFLATLSGLHRKLM